MNWEWKIKRKSLVLYWILGASRHGGECNISSNGKAWKSSKAKHEHLPRRLLRCQSFSFSPPRRPPPPALRLFTLPRCWRYPYPCPLHEALRLCRWLLQSPLAGRRPTLRIHTRREAIQEAWSYLQKDGGATKALGWYLPALYLLQRKVCLFLKENYLNLLINYFNTFVWFKTLLYLWVSLILIKFIFNTKKKNTLI